MRVLIAPDKFKGSLSAAHVAAHLATGVTKAGSQARVLPLADGGDGSVDAAVAAGFTPLPITVAGATGTPHHGRIAHDPVADTAVVEVADTCGLATLPGGRGSALDASSLGAGQAIAHALRQRPRRLVLALGGSASTDGGTGLLSALGYVFRDADGRQIRACGRTLRRIHTVDTTWAVDLSGVEVVVAGDVTNPLTGPTGAAAVYGPQKGADPAAVDHLEAGLISLVEAFDRSGHPHAHRLSGSAGAGAAGGIGYAAMLLGARMDSGAEFFLDLLDFDTHLLDADLVVTGEGSIDAQTEHGKLLSVLAKRAAPIPVVAVAGRNALPRTAWAGAGFTHIHALGDYTDRNTATDPDLTARLLTRIGTRIGRTTRRPRATR